MSHKRDVLVVEDDKSLNVLMCRFLEAAGLKARPALNGYTGVREALACAPCVVLLDLMLPDMTGFEVCQQLKDNSGTRDIPVIMVTAMTDDESRRRGMECGASAYITKPFAPDELIETIKKLAA